jgi:hypothetical protein
MGIASNAGDTVSPDMSQEIGDIPLSAVTAARITNILAESVRSDPDLGRELAPVLRRILSHRDGALTPIDALSAFEITGALLESARHGSLHVGDRGSFCPLH